MDLSCGLGPKGLISLFLLITLGFPGVTMSYNIGTGIADVTGPIAEIVFMGYAKIDQKGSGLHLRTFARSYIIDDAEERFVFVSVESAMIGHDVRATVIRKLEEKYGDMYTEKNVMISATHTHSTPGGYNLYVLFDLTTLGFIKQSFDALVNGIFVSIVRAHDSVVPGKLYVGRGEVLDANINRSPMAYLNNPQSERDKYKYNVDKTMTQLQFIAADGRPLGVINWFAVHPTSMNNSNRLVSSDNVGYAAVLFEKYINKDVPIGKGEFVAAFASSNLGDVSPNTRGPKCEFSGRECSSSYTCTGKNEMCFASGPGKDMFESTSIIAHKLFTESMNIWNNTSSVEELRGPVRVVHQFVKMPGQRATYFNHTTNQMEEVKTCLPAMGYSFAAGTTDGPGSFAFEQGTTTSNPMWNAVRNFVAAPTPEDIECQSPKPILLATGRMRLPYQWQPQVVSTHLAMIGGLVIAGVPGEFTTMSGRRMRENIASTAEEITASRPTVVIAGLCNTYSDYITTPEEYQIQRYEGASTIYGPHTLTIYLQQYRQLITAALRNKKIEPGPPPKNLTQENLITLQTPVVYDTAKWGKNFGDCIKQPDKVVRAGDTVSAIFVAGHPRNNLMTGRSFLTIEKSKNNSWVEIATDADWETKLFWARTSVIFGTSQVEISWEIPHDTEPGKYRIGHCGSYQYIFGGKYPYQGYSNLFEVKSQGSV
ncbi:neutral ceramidase [Microplitis mediator]|uniref:neutral ceramidase n=1 Tax=Microplitis mediator TaxID=375433 RepID=UPI0025544F47|nr:neutral ceramidase [Microplitis mediator]XP_057339607.1 neutral ceramidase [Microplitis mediator]XP_057339608.1 neutral ceramidase [Microplitis mediator]XP_057339609.1 neutral ceramidase [Microplitis mediator]XP_057339610.1 neutral ceramidase [Microplitis mediator]XP_057339612.1 neutral ceramidase [Microplitis mediator]